MGKMEDIHWSICKKQLRGMVALLGMAITQTVCAGDILIIANCNVKANEISQRDARDVFLGESTSVGASKVNPVVLQNGAAQDAFLQLVGKNEAAFEGTWRKLVFTGKGFMPHTCDSEDALIAYVRSTPGAIGYVSDGKSLAGVKVIKLK